jgi:hypothetical protein
MAVHLQLDVQMMLLIAALGVIHRIKKMNWETTIVHKIKFRIINIYKIILSILNMTGGLLQLAAYGAQNTYLSGNPQITFFVAVYKRYTNFAIQSVPQYFIGNADFGQKVYCQFDRIGDLINQIFLRIQLPDLSQYQYTDESGNIVEYFWVNSVGNAIVKIIELEIGGVTVDRQYGLWMEIWSELTVPYDHRIGYYDMVGKTDNPLNLNNNGAMNLYVPLQFWFCKNIGASLPLIALQAQEVRIIVTFRRYEELIISSNGIPLENSNLMIQQTYLDVDYIFLEDQERRFFAQSNHQYLIEQLQVYATSLATNSKRDNPVGDGTIRTPETIQNILLSFNNPVKELVWVIQNSTVLSVYPYGGNEWFNFSTESYMNNKVNGTDPMLKGKLIFEGQDLFDMKDAKYFRTVIPYQRHTVVPNNYIYCYSFAFKPEEFQPSGTCNFSRIDNQVLYMEVAADLIDPIITIFATNLNILNIAGGMAGVEYSS